MPTQMSEYRRLPGRGLRRTGVFTLSRTYCRLWLGADHLLSIDSTGYSEDYRRFYFPDIQAITVRKTSRGRNWNVAFGTLAVACALAGLPMGPIGAGIFWTLSGLLLLFLLINALRGPTCICHLQTAVQRDVWPSLGRLKVAGKVLAQIRPVVEQIQGTVTGEEVVERVRSSALEGMGQDSPASLHFGRPPPPAIVPVSKYSGWIHAVTFYLFLGLGAAGCIDFFVRHVVLVLLATALALGTSVAAVIAVVRQHDSGLSRRLQRLSWAAVAFILINGLIGYIRYFVFAVGRGDGTVEPGLEWRYMHVLAEISPLDSPFHLALSIFLVAGSWILGGLGLVWLQQFRRMRNRSQNAEAAPTANVARTLD
jgi:hypothetical protein